FEWTPLPPAVEIFRLKPTLERRLRTRPFGIEHCKPRRIAVFTLDDHVLAKNSFEGKTEPQRRAARNCIQRIALPFVPAVAERFECVAREEILRLGGEQC